MFLKVFLRLILAILAIMGVLLLIASLLPRDYAISQQVTIHASPETIFPEINQIDHWQEWSTWNSEISKNFEAKFSKNRIGKGATMTWNEPRGAGKMWFTESHPCQRIEFKLRFAGFPDMDGTLELSANPFEGTESTTVTWKATGTLPPGPFYGVFGFLFSGEMERQFGDSLNRLKGNIEKERKTVTKLSRDRGKFQSLDWVINSRLISMG